MSEATTNAGQSRKMSFLETAVSVLAGYVLNVLIQFMVYPLFDIEVAIEQAFVISLLITGIAFVKNFSVRRLFNFIHLKQVAKSSGYK